MQSMAIVGHALTWKSKVQGCMVMKTVTIARFICSEVRCCCYWRCRWMLSVCAMTCLCLCLC